MKKRANNVIPHANRQIKAPDIIRLLRDEKSSELSQSVVFEESMYFFRGGFRIENTHNVRKKLPISRHCKVLVFVL